MWQTWVNALLGLWLIASAYMLTGSTLMTNLVLSGIVIAGLALWDGVAEMNYHDKMEHSHA